MVDLRDLDDVLERVVAKGIVIEAGEDSLGAVDERERTSGRPAVPIAGVIVVEVTED